VVDGVLQLCCDHFAILSKVYLYFAAALSHIVFLTFFFYFVLLNKDANHKPDMVVAITEIKALCDFVTAEIHILSDFNINFGSLGHTAQSMVSR
jgi:Phosphomannose isomerase type I